MTTAARVSADPAPLALVTGAGRRIGAAIARRLHADGWRVALHCGRSREPAQALATAFCAVRAGSAAVFEQDLRAAGASAALVAAVAAEMGPVAALVNNASSYFATPIGQITAAQIEELVATNLSAPLLLTQAVWTAGGLKQVVNLLDIHSHHQPRAGFAAYTAAKGALWALTEALAVELAPAVRVNGVALGHVLAEVSDPPTAAELADLEDKQAQLGRVPLQRYGLPHEVAAAVAWLLSADSAFVSGTILQLDGGRRLA